MSINLNQTGGRAARRETKATKAHTHPLARPARQTFLAPPRRQGWNERRVGGALPAARGQGEFVNWIMSLVPAGCRRRPSGLAQCRWHLAANKTGRRAPRAPLTKGGRAGRLPGRPLIDWKLRAGCKRAPADKFCPRAPWTRPLVGAAPLACPPVVNCKRANLRRLVRPPAGPTRRSGRRHGRRRDDHLKHLPRRAGESSLLRWERRLGERAGGGRFQDGAKWLCSAVQSRPRTGCCSPPPAARRRPPACPPARLFAGQ